MKLAIPVLVFSLTLLTVLQGTVRSQYQVEYVVQIWEDGSATWTVQTVGINVSVDLFEFQNKVLLLVDAAKNVTGRGMMVVADSLSMNYTSSGSYGIVEYAFRWENFSMVEGTRIAIGDVFQVNSFFEQLYGDGPFSLTYPPKYVVVSVVPQWNQRDDAHQTLSWLGTADFANVSSPPNIVLEERATTTGMLEILQQNAVFIGGLVAIISGSSFGFFLFRRQRKRLKMTSEMPGVASIAGMETGEEKIMKLLKASGGSLQQSAIVDQCRFSKAKTSQLLAGLEEKGMVLRVKKGRDKIVTLVEKR